MVTHPQFRRMVEKYRRLLTPEWKIDVVFEIAPDQDPDGCNASIGVIGDYHRAELYCNPTALDRPVEEVERTACHEVLHLVLHDLDEAADEAIRQLGPQASYLAGAHRRTATERAVDRLSRVILSLD